MLVKLANILFNKMKACLCSPVFLILLIVLVVSIILNSMPINNDNQDKSVQIFSVDESHVNNPKLVPNWEAIDKIFRHNKDVQLKPLKIVVVCGEPRLGKSTFCSLLYNNNPDCIKVDYDGDTINSTNKVNLGRADQIKKVFETAKDSFKPKTKGVWITPKPITVKSKWRGDILFNVFIVDVEGILGPNSEKFIYQQLFVLSSLMSSHFVYYLRHPFNEYNHLILKMYTTLAKNADNKNQDLILLISNVKNNLEFSYGSQSSDKYMLTLNKDVQIDLQIFYKYFKSVQCYLMPEPAEKMRTGIISDSDPEYNVTDIGKEYMDYLLEFREMITYTMDGIKASEVIKNMTGEKYADLLKIGFNLISSGNLNKIPNLFRITANDMNGNEVKRIIAEYETELKPYFNDFLNDKIKHDDLTIINTNITNKWLGIFSNNTFYDWIGTDNRDFSKELQIQLKQIFDDFVHNFKLYKYCINNYMIWISQFLNSKKYDEDDSDNREIKREHNEISKKLLAYFDERCKNNGQSSCNNFRASITKEIEKIYGPIEINILQLKSNLRKHQEAIKAYYNSQPWYKNVLSFKSNIWIEANNKHFNDIYNQFRLNIDNHLKKHGFDIEQIFLDKTNENFQNHYNQERTTENVKIAATSFLAAITPATLTLVPSIPIALTLAPIIATGGAAAVVVGGGLYVARELFKPDTGSG